MSDEVSPSVSYVYNTTNTTSSLGGPLFILLYIQCGMFALNGVMNLSMELWQLIFPTFVVVITFVAGLLNQSRT